MTPAIRVRNCQVLAPSLTIIFILALLCQLSSRLHVVAANEEANTCTNPTCEGVRVISEEELKANTYSPIWLSVLGEVYDVSKGEKFYGVGAGYSFFAGRDASPCFATGKFDEDGLKASFDDIPVSQLQSIEGWRKFYQGKDKYPFIGVLEGAYYDSDGKPTPLLRDIRNKLRPSEGSVDNIR